MQKEAGFQVANTKKLPQRGQNSDLIRRCSSFCVQSRIHSLARHHNQQLHELACVLTTFFDVDWNKAWSQFCSNLWKSEIVVFVAYVVSIFCRCSCVNSYIINCINFEFFANSREKQILVAIFFRLVQWKRKIKCSFGAHRKNFKRMRRSFSSSFL